MSGIKPLTADVHAKHASVIDPTNGLALDASDNRSACYRCHPGALTKCLRGVMGAAVAADGSLAIQCQSCHGSMSAVGASNRTGWLMEPNCQACHDGATRYTSVFDSPGHVRVPADTRFATNPDAPAAGLSLYRFSKGHGGLYCEACHGSTHAEFPATHPNDNVQSLQHQGHIGMFSDCAKCHGTTPATIDGGPHGLHPIGAAWVSQHANAAESNGTSQCRVCHGADYRGTVLSRSLVDQTLSTKFGTKNFWRGFQISCYTCHNGPDAEGGNANHAPLASIATLTTSTNTPAATTLVATDADGNALTLRIVSQPAHGTVGLVGTTATYYPEENFGGSDSFTFAANDGQTDSNLGKILVGVGITRIATDFGGHWMDLVQTCKKTCKLKGHFVVQNTGAATVPTSVLAIYLSNDATLDGSDTLLRQYKIRAISPGQSLTKSVSGKLPVGTDAHGKYILALADADDAVLDADDNNDIAIYGPLP